MFPVRADGLCACGCGKALTGRRTRWAANVCSRRAGDAYALRKGDSQAMRRAVYDRDKGNCAECGEYDGEWQADHIIEWADGGTHDLENIQTLCLPCHKTKTKESRRLRIAARKDQEAQ